MQYQLYHHLMKMRKANEAIIIHVTQGLQYSIIRDESIIDTMNSTLFVHENQCTSYSTVHALYY